MLRRLLLNSAGRIVKPAFVPRRALSTSGAAGVSTTTASVGTEDGGVQGLPITVEDDGKVVGDEVASSLWSWCDFSAEITQLHEISGLPWWAFMACASIFVR